jgi:hypothetical protein
MNFKIANPTLTAGEAIQVEFLWQTLQTPPVDYTVFVHLMDDNGQMVAGHDSQPVNNSYPTTIWTPAEHILDPHTLAVPADLPAGQYHLTVGLYYQPTGERLPVQLREGQPDTEGEFMLDTAITVAASQ